MDRFVMLLVCAVALLANMVDADTVEHTFHIRNMTIKRLCEEKVVVTANGQLPGPTIEAREGDTVVVHVVNHSPYNITIHWHGMFQRLTPWSDGPSYVTQCPIQPGQNYTYKYFVTTQVGTLWYHAHVSFLRATVYGAVIIRPKSGSRGYPFPKPEKEIPLLLGEWWKDNVVDIENRALQLGGFPIRPDGYTINGVLGSLYNCSKEMELKVTVKAGKTYLLRLMNVALNSQFFFKVAGHTLTVVAADASYTTPYRTDIVVLAPGHTVDALLVADASPSSSYYIAISEYFSAVGQPDPAIPPTTAVLHYEPTSSSDHRRHLNLPPLMPELPTTRDTATAHRFYSNLTALVTDGSPKVPLEVDERMFVTLGLGLMPCEHWQTCGQPFPGQQAVASMNNVSFVLPSALSLLEAHYHNASAGIYTADFPDAPPKRFNFTDLSPSDLALTEKGTRMKRLRYNSTVEVVLQNTGFVSAENHPIHLHGYNFFVVAMGFGNFDPEVEERRFNLVNPQVRNTVAVPLGGWAVIRFVADNPGVWIMHCHLDLHLPIGLGMAFIVENGDSAESTIPPPPVNLPKC